MSKQQDTKLTPQILAMYLGCRMETPYRYYPDPKGPSVRKQGVFMCIDLVIQKAEIWLDGDEKENLTGYDYKDVKPILRRLSSMTTEESHWWNARKQRKGFMAQVHADNTLWLCSKSFDLFGLIDAGLAIDAKTLKA